MISDTSLETERAIDRYRADFREDVAEQLRLAAERAGLASNVTASEAKIVLELAGSGPNGDGMRVLVRLNDVREGVPGWVDWVTLSAETPEGRTPLLTLAWRGDEGLSEEEDLSRRLAEWEARVDRDLPLERRGLNARADVRTGRYGRGDIASLLVRDLRSAAARRVPLAAQQSGALAVIEPPARRVLARQADQQGRLDTGGLRALDVHAAANLDLQRANVSEQLIAAAITAMKTDLAEAESHFAGPGVAVSAQAGFGRIMEWVMVGAAYGVEAKTNQIAVASFLGGGASWLYGLVGPVLIGGLAAISTSKTGKGAAYALMIAWALAMAGITASDKGRLDRAQRYFPKQAVVLLHEQTVAAARLKRDAADAELKRLNAPVKETSALLADARKRWQAEEIKRAAQDEAARREMDRAHARETLLEAGLALGGEETQLREAILSDPSRAWAWRTLFAIFAVINLAGPLAISRVLEKWRADHREAQAGAKEDHKQRSTITLLRERRSAQTAHAMTLLPALVEELKRGGVATEVIAVLDLSGISQKAAERFDHAVNSKRTARRLFRLSPSAGGPG